MSDDDVSTQKVVTAAVFSSMVDGLNEVFVRLSQDGSMPAETYYAIAQVDVDADGNVMGVTAHYQAKSDNSNKRMEGE